jgi:hypothetical protein
MSNSELYRTDRQCAEQLFLNNLINLNQYKTLLKRIERKVQAVEKAEATHQRNSAGSWERILNQAIWQGPVIIFASQLRS